MSSGLPTILEKLRCDRASNDRRRHPRVGLRARVSIETLERMNQPQPAWMRDVSEGGAGLLVPCPLRIDQSILLNLPSEKSQTIGVRCRVIHCQKIGAFWWAGVQFVQRPWREPKPSIVSTHKLPEEGSAQIAGFDAERRRISDSLLD